MANNGTTTIHRLSTPPPPPTSSNDELKSPYQKHIYTFSLSFPFNIPSSPESAAVRIVKNLERFSLYYAIFVWTVLFIALVPRRNVSIVFLVAMTEVTVLYFLLLRALPDSVILHRIIDKRVVLFVLFVVTALLLILTQAAAHLFIVLGATVPVVVLHAVLVNRDYVFANEEPGEMARLVRENLGGLGGSDVAQPDNLV